MTAQLIVHNDPFRPTLNVCQTEILSGKTICETLIDSGFCFASETGIVRTCPFIVIYNGEAILQEHWNTVLLEDDYLHISRLPAGGGGGSNIGNIIGAIVIAVVAYFTFGLGLVAAAAVGVGAYAVLSLAGQAVPTSLSNDLNSSSSSPTYSLNAQGNAARLLEAMPRVYGRMRTYPDLAAQPYSEYEGNEQFLYQLFCISLGEIAVEKISLDDTDINDFEDAQYEIIKPFNAVTLFPDNVVSSDAVTGQTLLAPNEQNATYVGPYTVVPAGQTASYLGVDIVFPQGIGQVNDKGGNVAYSVTVLFQYKEIDNSGNDVSDWKELFTKTFTGSDTTAKTFSVKTQVQPGRYQIRANRTSAKPEGDLANRTYSLTQWASARAYLTSTYTYGNCTLLAVKARATNLLNSTTARKLSVISIGKVRTWDPVNGYSEPTASANPAWIGADILTNEDYGRGLPTSRINIQQLYALSQTCQTRGDEFNGVFDTTQQLWNSLSEVFAVCRTVPMYYAGVIDFIRDDVQSVPRAKFAPQNMLAGSFEITHQFFDVDTPDHVVIQYVDSTTWETAEVSCELPGEPALNPSTVEIKGVTSRAQAWRLGISMAAANRDRRKTITFSTLTEALVLKYNQLIRINHDVPQWGYSGRIYSFDSNTDTFTVSEQIRLDESSTNVFSLRKLDGSEYGQFTIVQDLSDALQDIYVYKVTLSNEQRSTVLQIVSDGILRDYTFFTAGPSERQGIKALVKSIKPDQEGRVTVTCMNYADSVYSAENGGVVPTPPIESDLPSISQAPVVDSVTVAYTVVIGQQNIIATPARGATYYEFQAKKDGTNTWILLASQTLPTLVANLSPGTWTVRVRGIARNVGPWASWTGVIEATSLPTARLDSFSATSAIFSILIQWSYSASSASIAKTVQIYSGVTNVLGNASLLVELAYPANGYAIYNLEPGERRYLWARVIDTGDRIGPWFNDALPITQVATNDPDKLLKYLNGQITSSQLSQELSTRIDSASGADVKIQEIKNSLAAMYTIKTQLTVDGIPFTAGIGVGVENNNGIITQQVLFLANRLALINPNSGAYSTPFVIDGNNTYIDSAFIRQATITNALIGATIKSVATVSSGPNSALPVREDNYMTGTMTMRGVSFTRVDSSTGTKMTDVSTGVVVIEWGELS